MKNAILRPFTSLTGQIYLFFILIFCIAFTIAVILPSFDSRNYSLIESRELNDYNSIVFSIMEKMSSTDVLNIKNTDNFLEKKYNLNFAFINNNDVIFSKNYEDLVNLRDFIYHSNSPLIPQKKQFDDTQIIGPFQIKLDNSANNLDKLDTYRIYFIKPTKPLSPIIQAFFDKPVLMLIIIVILTAPLLLILSYRITKPIIELRRAVNNVAVGNFSINTDLEKNGPKEIQAVGKSFNQMVTAIDNLLNSQKRMLSDISHELRTPLARLKLSAAILRRKNGETPELTRIETEAERLEQMISDILNISRQQINTHLEHEIFPIEEIWEDVLENARFETEQSKQQLIINNQIKHPHRYRINGNPNALAGALENIIRNAEKYGNNTIRVSFSINQNELIMMVEDDGNGIDESEYQNIFQPFYRIDTARTRETGGIGLGLAIVFNTVQQHQGYISAQKSELGGLSIEIRLPLWFD